MTKRRVSCIKVLKLRISRCMIILGLPNSFATVPDILNLSLIEKEPKTKSNIDNLHPKASIQ